MSATFSECFFFKLQRRKKSKKQPTTTTSKPTNLYTTAAAAFFFTLTAIEQGKEAISLPQETKVMIKTTTTNENNQPTTKQIEKKLMNCNSFP